MINGFFTTVQQDAVMIYDSLSGKLSQDSQKDKKVALAAFRIFAAVAMGSALFFGATALPFLATAPAGALFKMAFAAACYALAHDVFVMADNVSNQSAPVNGLAAIGKSLWEDIVDVVKGKKNGNAAPRQPVTENTFYRPLWDAALTRA